jgi:hypothetical protein
VYDLATGQQLMGGVPDKSDRVSSNRGGATRGQQTLAYPASSRWILSPAIFGRPYPKCTETRDAAVIPRSRNSAGRRKAPMGHNHRLCNRQSHIAHAQAGQSWL